MRPHPAWRRLTTLSGYEMKPSLSQAVRMKKLKQSGDLTIEMIDQVPSEEKKLPKSEKTSSVRFRKYFSFDYTQKQIDEVIIGLLKDWRAKSAV